MLPIIGLSIATVVIGYLGVSLVLSWLLQREVLDIPNSRSSHTTPTPKGGGLVIVAITIGGTLIAAAWLGQLRSVWWYLAGGAMIAAVSWLDDLRELPSAIRFSVHGVGAALAIAGYGYWTAVDLPFLPGLNLGWIGLVATFVWIAGLTNAYNFMDGIDGIAGVQAVWGGLVWAVLGWSMANPTVSVIGLLICCSSLGFLAQNWPPARIFMGDVGSAFLGFSFAVLPLMAARNPPERNRLLLTGILVMWPFVFDSAFTIVRRALRGENVVKAHRSHLYQRLTIVGRSHRFVTTIYGVLAAVSALIAVYWQWRGAAGDITILLAIASLSGIIWVFTIGQERRHAANMAGPQPLARERL
jgi:UDP-N-acetylmuramyl pentapeptide phosphotransferase/UDP-N-acetylglucosamine-1-phosphate transferase